MARCRGRRASNPRDPPCPGPSGSTSQEKVVMTDSATRFVLPIVFAVSLVIALLGFFALESRSGGVNDPSRSTLWLPQTAATQDSHPGAPPEADRAKKARVDESSHAGIVETRQANAISDPGVATADDTIWLSQPHNNAFDRFEAISALGDSNEAIAEMTLVDLLHDNDPAIRESAIESLASLGTYGAIQGLSFALTDTDPLVRQSALEFLVEIDTPDSLAALTATLNDPDVDSRLAAVYELADAENATASSLLQQFLADTDPSVRQVAAEFIED